jgi:Mu-like prophage I protein
MNSDGTFKHGFDGCILHLRECEGHSEASAKKICGKIAQAVANTSGYGVPPLGGRTLAFTNEAAIESDGWCLIAPFGEWPKTRTVRASDGSLREQRFLQVVDNEAADNLVTGGNFIRRLKRALVGITAYKGHPDLARYSPETVASQISDAPVALGLVDKLRKTDRGVEAHFSLLPDQAHVVENEGYKYPSVLWNVEPTGETRHGAAVVRPSQLLSVGLTPTPNISGVDSLANARTNTPAAIPQPQDTEMKSLVLGWLAANGITLANESSDQTVLEALQHHFSGRITEATALSNERTALTAKITALENERHELAQKLTDAGVALANAQSELKSARASRAGYLVDLAIQKGILAVAERDARIIALTNSADFAADAKALLQEAVKHRVAGTIPSENGDRKALANAGMADPRKLFLGLVSKKMAESKMSYKDAYAAALAENPALLEQMKNIHRHAHSMH